MRHRLPAVSFFGMLGLVAAAVVASSSASQLPPGVARGTYGTVPPAATTPVASATTSTLPSDATKPDDPTVLTVPPGGYLPGFDTDAFDHAIADRLLGAGDLAVSIAVAKDGHLVHTAAYGIANPATGEPAVATDRFRIASNSKMITSTVILQLVAAGDLTLDDRVLPRLAAQFGVALGDRRMNDVTLRMLLNHTSGFSDFQAEFFRGQAVGCEDVTVEALKGRLSTTPGTYVKYSNENFCLLGLLIEQVTGDGYEQAVQDRLLTPLGITDMRTTGNDDLRPGEVVHLGGDQRNFMEVLGGAGAWVATSADMVKIVDSLDTNRPGWHPIPESLATEMRAPNATVGAHAGQWLGLGLRVWGDGTWGHTGTIQNAHSMVIHQPNGYTWAVLVSGDSPQETDNLRQYVDRAFELAGTPPGPVIPYVFGPSPGGGPTTTVSGVPSLGTTTTSSTTTSVAATSTVPATTTTRPRRPAPTTTAADVATTIAPAPPSSEAPPVETPPVTALPPDAPPATVPPG